MGLLDAFALAIVVAVGGMARPEFSAVAASTFGMLTTVLAWWLLKEPMTPAQWIGIAITFAGIGYLIIHPLGGTFSLSPFDAAPLIGFSATKETDFGGGMSTLNKWITAHPLPGNA